MTGWIIFGSIMLVLILLFIQSVKVTFIYEKGIELTVKYLFITLFRFPAPKKKKKPKKAKKASSEESRSGSTSAEESESADGAADEEKSDETEDGVPEKTDKKAEKKKNGFKLDFGMIKDYIDSASPPIKRLFKKIRTRDLYIDWVVGSDDAAKTAIKYGTVSGTLYAVIKWLTMYFDVKPKEINIEADFGAEKDDIFVYCTIKLRVCTALACGIWLLFRVAKTYFKYNSAPNGAGNKSKSKKKKAAAR